MPRLRHMSAMHMLRLPPARRRRQRPVRVHVVVELVPVPQVDPDVVVRELAHLRVVDAQDLRFFRRAQAQPRDEVHDPEDDRLCGRGPGPGREGEKRRGAGETTVSIDRGDRSRRSGEKGAKEKKIATSAR